MLKAIRAHGARKTILALPYATKSSLFRHESEADTLVALHILEMPLLPNAVYEDYRSPSFEQVQALLCGESVDVDGDLAPLFHRALVAVDFSPCSTRAVRYASRLVGPEGELALLHVVPGTLDTEDFQTEDFQALENAIEDLRELERRRVPPGIESVRVVTTGSIDESIIRASIAGSHEVIVMGTHGRTGVQRLLLGSVAERVVRQSDIPVLVVPA